jgi:hypothetical protein
MQTRIRLIFAASPQLTLPAVISTFLASAQFAAAIH